MPEPDPALAQAITRSMSAGNGRSHVVKDRAELIARLGEDGVEFTKSDVLTVLSKMIEDGRIERRPGVGLWLGNGIPTLWESGVTNLADVDGPSWG